MHGVQHFAKVQRSAAQRSPAQTSPAQANPAQPSTLQDSTTEHITAVQSGVAQRARVRRRADSRSRGLLLAHAGACGKPELAKATAVWYSPPALESSRPVSPTPRSYLFRFVGPASGQDLIWEGGTPPRQRALQKSSHWRF